MSGLPPIIPVCGQDLADAAKRDILAFACAQRLRDAVGATKDVSDPTLFCQDCYPSLTLLPGPHRIGQFFACNLVNPSARPRLSGGQIGVSAQFPLCGAAAFA